MEIWIAAVQSYEDDFMDQVWTLATVRPFATQDQAMRFATRYGFVGGIAVATSYPSWATRFQGISERVSPYDDEMRTALREFVEEFRL
jgi:hypothetical protein